MISKELRTVVEKIGALMRRYRDASPCEPVAGRAWKGFDTETQDGAAILVATDRESCDVRNFADVARFLLSRPGSFAAFNMDYDARAVIKLLPRRLWKQLIVINKCSLAVKGLGLVRISYFKGKEFALACGDRRAAIYDVWQFYQQGSLEKTARAILGRETGKDSIPKTWLANMARALKLHGERVRAYCIRDAELALLLMDRVRTQFETLKLDFARPLSPASMASRYFGSRIRFKLPRWTNDILRRSYNGGRIECAKRGAFTGEIIGYDINSAYPWAMSRLPDPSGGELIHVGATFNPGIVYGSYKCELHISPDLAFGPVPFASKLGLIYPCGIFTRWIDRFTLDYLRKLDGVKIRILDAFELINHSREQLFPDLGKLYLERKKRPDISLALKIVLNGLYGKMAQALPIYGRATELTGEDAFFYEGSFRAKRDRYANYTHFGIASATTSLVRNRLHATMMIAPEKVILVATDGIMSHGEIPGVECGKELGDWSIKFRSDLAIVVGAGVYYCRMTDGTSEERVRGLRGSKKLLDLLDSKLARWKISVTVIDSLADGVRERESRMNVIRKATKNFDVNFDKRRVWPGPWKRAADLKLRSQDSTAHIIL